MSGKIYLIQSNNTLQALSQQPYPNEDLFQGLLEKYSDLLKRITVNPRTFGGQAYCPQATPRSRTRPGHVATGDTA